MSGSYSGSAIAPHRPVSSSGTRRSTCSTRAIARSRPMSSMRVDASRPLRRTRAPFVSTMAAPRSSRSNGAIARPQGSRVPCRPICGSRRPAPRRPNASANGQSGARSVAAHSSFHPLGRRRSDSLLSYRPPVMKQGMYSLAAKEGARAHDRHARHRRKDRRAAGGTA